MSMRHPLDAREEAYWEAQEAEQEALEILRSDLESYIESAIENGELPSVYGFLEKNSTYLPSSYDAIDREFNEIVQEYQGTWEVAAI